jgi:hypothetical protein
MSRRILTEPNTLNLYASSINTDSLVVNDVIYNLPTDDGINGQVLTTDGAGNLTFENAGGGSNISTFQLNNVLGFAGLPTSPVVEAITGTHTATTSKTLIQSIIPIRSPGPVVGRIICTVFINGVAARPYDAEVELEGLTSMTTTLNVLFTHATTIGTIYTYSLRVSNQMNNNASTGGFELIYRTLVITSI